ncbi:MAG: hypothetical protein ABI054_00675 [Planctomycetota bacterium]
MIRPIAHVCAALLLAGLSSSCMLAVGTDGSHLKEKPKTVTLSDGSAGSADTKPQEAGAAKEEKKPSPEAVAKKAARKAEKKAREATYAHMELALAEMDAANELHDANFELLQAKHGLEAAQRELDHFQKAERPLNLEDSQIDLDRSNESAIEQKQELEELMAMYKADDYAKMTKELVINRGKFRLEVAQREAELAKKRAADKKDHDMAVKERDLGLALAKAQDGVSSAEAKLKKVQAHNELELMRAHHKIEDAERPDDDEEESGSAPKGA